MASPSTETIQRAIDALLKWRNSNSTQKLIDDDNEFLYLVVTLKKTPQNGVVTAPHTIPLPHTLLSPSSQTCLILDDRPSKSGPTKAQAQSKIAAENVAVSTVLKLSKLASDYKPFEAKRKLCDSHDVFFADKRVVSLLPRLLGKQFFKKKKKVPLPLDLRKGSWKEQVERACSSVAFAVGNGTCSVVRVAKVSMARDEIVANVAAAIQGVIEVVPKKWGNVRSFHVKLLESLALPVYHAVPDVRLRIEGGKGEGEKEEKKEEEGEKKGVKKMKGRIGEMRYMDGEVGEDCVDGELGSEDSDGDDWGVVSKEGDSENGEKGSWELVSKKRKKGGKVANGDLSELSSVKRAKNSAKDMGREGGKDKRGKVSGKAMKENYWQSRNGNISGEDGESGKKMKKNSGLFQSDMPKNVKAKRS